MKIALDAARRDLGIARKEIIIMEADYVNVVPKRKFDQLEENYTVTLAAKNEFEKNYKSLSSEHAILRDTYKQVLAERNEAVTQNESLSRVGTPRPNWDEVATAMNDTSYIDAVF